jgi:predicted metal-binding protein
VSGEGGQVSEPETTVYVCTVCRAKDDPEVRPGHALLEALGARLTAEDRAIVAAEPVECLGVCSRPCTVAMAARGKWTYVLGDFDNVADVDDLIEAARRYTASETGLVPKKDRPDAMRKGIISRTPPAPNG